MICIEDWKNNAEVNLYLDRLLEEIAPEYIYFLKNRVVPETKKFRIVYCCTSPNFIPHFIISYIAVKWNILLKKCRELDFGQ